MKKSKNHAVHGCTNAASARMRRSGHFLLLMRTIPGAHPSGALRASKFAPGEFVVLTISPGEKLGATW